MFALLSFIALPALLRHAIPRALEARGFPSSVDGVRVDLFGEEITLLGFDLGRSERPFVTFGEVRINVALRALLDGRIKIRNIRVRDAQFDFEALSESRLMTTGKRGDLGVDVDELVIEDLRLPVVSEAAGHEVAVRRLRLSEARALSSPAGTGFVLELSVDDAPLYFEGSLRTENGDAFARGRYQVDRLPLSAVMRAGSGDADADASGAADGAGEFDIRFDADESMIAIRVEGANRIKDLAGKNFAEGGRALWTLQDGDLDWRGEIGVDWRLLEGPTRAHATGRLDIRRLNVAWPDSREPELADIRASDTVLEGGWSWVDGRSVSDFTWRSGVLELAGRGDANPGWTLALVDSSGKVAHRDESDPAPYSLTIENGRGERVVYRPARSALRVVLENWSVEEYRFAPNAGYRIEAAAAGGATGLATAEGALVDEVIWRVDEPSARSISVESNGVARVERLSGATVQVRSPAGPVELTDVELQELARGADERIAAGRAAIGKLLFRDSSQELWVEDIVADAVVVSNDLTLVVRDATVGRSHHRIGETTAWEAGNVILRGVSGRVGDRFELAGAGAASLTYSPAEGGTLELGSLVLEAATLEPDYGGTVGRLSTRNLQFTEPASGRWDGDQVRAEQVVWTAAGTGSARRVSASSARHVTSDAESWELHRPVLDLVEVGGAGSLAAGSVDLSGIRLTRKDGAIIASKRLSARRARRPAQGTAAIDELQINDLDFRDAKVHWIASPVAVFDLERISPQEIRAGRLTGGGLLAELADGSTWRATALTAAKFSWTEGGHGSVVGADPVSLGRLSVRGSGGQQWWLEDVDATALVWTLGALPAARSFAAANGAGTRASGEKFWQVRDVFATNARRREDGAIEIGSADVRRFLLEHDPGVARIALSASSARGIAFDGPEDINVDTADLTFVEIQSLDPGHPASAIIARSRLAEVNLVPGRQLEMGAATLRGLDAQMGVDEHGAWQFPPLGFSDDDAGRFAVRVGRLETKGEARLTLYDQSIEPPYRIEFSPLRVAIRDFDSVNPASRARLDVRTGIGGFGSLETTGQLTPTVQGFDLAARGKLTGLDLVLLSAYSEKFLDTVVDRGRADVDFDLTLTDGQLEGVGDIVLSKLEVAPTPSVRAEAQSETEEGDPQPVPLATSLALLKDNEGTVRLRVPVRGPLRDPEFDFSDAVGEAILRTVQGAVTLTFKPLGLLLRAGRLFDRSLGFRIDPVPFRVGTTSATAEGLTRLDELAKQLKAHPQMRVALCAKVVPADVRRIEQATANALGQGAAGKADKPALIEGVGVDPKHTGLSLANARSEVVRKYLHEEHGVSPSQLDECTPVVEAVDGGLPRLESELVAAPRRP